MNTFIAPAHLEALRSVKATFDFTVNVIRSIYGLSDADHIDTNGNIIRAAKATEDASECQDEPSVGDKVVADVSL